MQRAWPSLAEHPTGSFVTDIGVVERMGGVDGRWSGWVGWMWVVD